MQSSFVYLLPTRSLLDGLPECRQLALLQALVGRRLDGLIGGHSVGFPIRTHPREFNGGTHASPAACFGDRYIFDEFGTNQTFNLFNDAVSIFARKGAGEMRDPRKPYREVDIREAELITCIEDENESTNHQRMQKQSEVCSKKVSYQSREVQYGWKNDGRWK